MVLLEMFRACANVFDQHVSILFKCDWSKLPSRHLFFDNRNATQMLTAVETFSYCPHLFNQKTCLENIVILLRVVKTLQKRFVGTQESKWFKNVVIGSTFIACPTFVVGFVTFWLITCDNNWKIVTETFCLNIWKKCMHLKLV